MRGRERERVGLCKKGSVLSFVCVLVSERERESACVCVNLVIFP